MGYSFRLRERVLLYAPSHRQDNTYHGLCYTSRGALAGMKNSSMGPPHEGSNVAIQQSLDSTGDTGRRESPRADHVRTNDVLRHHGKEGNYWVKDSRSDVNHSLTEGRKEGIVLFNDTLNTLRLYRVRLMIKRPMRKQERKAAVATWATLSEGSLNDQSRPLRYRQ